MRIRMRIILPLVQMAIAVALTVSNYLRPISVVSPAWTAPDRQICDGLNAPAALIRIFLTRLVSTWISLPYRMQFWFETIVYILLVGLLWYTVGIEISDNGQSVLTRKTTVRRVTDVLAFIFGTVLAGLGIVVRGQFGVVTTYSNLIAIPYYLWGTAIAILCGRDLWVSFSGPRGSATS